MIKHLFNKGKICDRRDKKEFVKRLADEAGVYSPAELHEHGVQHRPSSGVCKTRNLPEPTGTTRNRPEPTRNPPEPTRKHPEPTRNPPEQTRNHPEPAENNKNQKPGSQGFFLCERGLKNQIKIIKKNKK